MNVSLKKLSVSAIYTGLALIAFMLESLFPPLIIPGARLGLSNVFILIIAITVGTPHAIYAVIIKGLIGSIFSGNLSAIIYSLPAGLVSIIVQIILLRFTDKFSVIAISTTGSTINLITQTLIFCLITSGFKFLIYLPYLTLIGIVSGFAVGFAVYLIIKRLPKAIIISEEKF